VAVSMTANLFVSFILRRFFRRPQISRLFSLHCGLFRVNYAVDVLDDSTLKFSNTIIQLTIIKHYDDEEKILCHRTESVFVDAPMYCLSFIVCLWLTSVEFGCDCMHVKPPKLQTSRPTAAASSVFTTQ
jgi:hypothetical protein